MRAEKLLRDRNTEADALKRLRKANESFDRVAIIAALAHYQRVATNPDAIEPDVLWVSFSFVREMYGSVS